MKIITFLIDTLFPLRKTERVVRDTSAQTVRSLYRHHHHHEYVCLSEYNDPLIRTLITENKFYGNKKASHLLATLLDEYLSMLEEEIIVLPVPLGIKRERDRGYNQVHEVVKQLEKRPGIQIKPELCKRIHETKPQTSLPRSERLKNTSNAFKANEILLQQLQNCTILVVDDVCTTGSTFLSIQISLKKHIRSSCKIICVALAH